MGLAVIVVAPLKRLEDVCAVIHLNEPGAGKVSEIRRLARVSNEFHQPRTRLGIRLLGDGATAPTDSALPLLHLQHGSKKT